LLIVLGFTAGGSLIFYTFTTYMQKYLVNTAHMGAKTASNVMTVVLLIYMLLQPVFGIISGTAEYVALWFKSAGREEWFAWYVTGMLCIGFVASLMMPDTRKHGYLEGDGRVEGKSSDRR
jgi:Na+/melibiose symporter-like transporter